MYFDNDFSDGNKKFEFLNYFNSNNDIQIWVDLITSKFVLQFKPKEESENDFIHFFTNPIING